MTRYFIIDEVDHLDRSWLPTGKDVYVIPGNVNVYSRATKKGIKCIAIESHTSQKELDAIARKNEKLCENVCNQYIDLKIPHTVGIDLADLKQAFYPDCKRIIDTATFRLFMLRKFMSTVDDGIVYYFAQGKSEIYNEKSSLSRFAEHIKNEYENIQVYD